MSEASAPIPWVLATAANGEQLWINLHLVCAMQRQASGTVLYFAHGGGHFTVRECPDALLGSERSTAAPAGQAEGRRLDS